MNNIELNFDDENKTNSAWMCSSNNIDKLIFNVIESAKSVHLSLNYGLPKCVYQLKLYNDLLKKGFQLQTEMSALNLAVKQEAGRELIVVNQSLVIECIADMQTNEHHHKRIMFDLENNNYRKGLLINFSDEMQSDMISTSKHHSVFH